MWDDHDFNGQAVLLSVKEFNLVNYSNRIRLPSSLSNRSPQTPVTADHHDDH
jgi:hypothetical protein